MKCNTCNCYWQDEWEAFPTCKADPNWPAPCEYEDEEEEVEDHYTLADLGNNWW